MNTTVSKNAENKLEKSSKCISYRKRIHREYKYELAEDYAADTGIHPASGCSIDGYVALAQDGGISIALGYAWDGPSGPAIDTPSFMRGSLVHDALYQLLRKGFLGEAGEWKANRKRADTLLRTMCLEDEMNPVMAWLVYFAVRLFGGESATPRMVHVLVKLLQEEPAEAPDEGAVWKAPKSCR